MLRLALISVLSLVASTAAADTVGSYSKCKRTGNEAACKSCLASGNFYNFDSTRKKWVCGETTGMKRSTPVEKKKPTKPIKPSSVKKR